MQIFSPRGQVVGMLLHVLSQLPYSQKRAIVTGYIRTWELFSFAAEDWKPYPSMKEKGGDEPRWATLVAWARQDCIDRGWMERRGKDRWLISALGRRIIQKTFERAAAGKLDVRHGYLWTTKFKKTLCPSYQADAKDAKRPLGSIYEDTQFSALLDAYRE